MKYGASIYTTVRYFLISGFIINQQSNKNMGNEALEKINEIYDTVKKLEQFLPTTDRMTFAEYCLHRTNSGAHLTVPGLKKWIAKGCPKEDANHVSRTAVDKWAQESNTRKPKN